MPPSTRDPRVATATPLPHHLHRSREAMRGTVLLWSAAGGAIVGLMAGIALFALGAMVAATVPAAGRLAERFWWAGAALCFVVIPLAGGIVGYLEGRLKL